jgi:hypothetical protein
LNDFIDDVLDSEDVSEHVRGPLPLGRAECQSRGPLPLCQILFQESRRKSVLHVNKMRLLRSMLSVIMRQTQL